MLNRDAMEKYERPLAHGKDTRHIRDGISFPEVFSSQQWAKQPANHTLQLLDWSIFNLIAGNADCHAKNLSFFVGHKGIELAPFYDLVNVMLFDFAHDWAIGLGDEFLDGGVLPSTFDLACLAHACNLQGTLVSNRFQKQIEILQKQASDILANLPCHNSQEEKHLKKYLQVLRKRLDHLEKHSRGIQRAMQQSIQLRTVVLLK